MLEHHHPGWRVACSFQKEEAVLIDMLTEARAVGARGLHVDTGVPSPRPYRTWRRARAALRRPGRDSSTPSAKAASRGTSSSAARRARWRRSTLALEGPRRLDHRPAPRAGANPARARPSSPSTPAAGSGRRTRSRTGTRRRSGITSLATTSPTTHCTTAVTSRSAACPVPFRGPGAKGAGPVATRPSAAFTSETSMSPTTTAGVRPALRIFVRLSLRRCMCCGRWRRGLSGRCCCFRGGRIRLCCCGWRRRRFARRGFRFR